MALPGIGLGSSTLINGPVVPYTGAGSAPSMMPAAGQIMSYTGQGSAPPMYSVNHPIQGYNSSNVTPANLNNLYGAIRNMLGANPQAAQKFGGTNNLDTLSLLTLAKNYYINAGQQPTQPMQPIAPQRMIAPQQMQQPTALPGVGLRQLTGIQNGISAFR